MLFARAVVVVDELLDSLADVFEATLCFALDALVGAGPSHIEVLRNSAR